MRRRTVTVLVGGAFWGLALGGGLLLGRSSAGTRVTDDGVAGGVEAAVRVEMGRDGDRPAVDGRTIGEQLWGYWSTPFDHIELAMPEVPARAGDAIYLQGSDGKWRQAGYLTWTDQTATARVARAVWHADELDVSNCEFIYYRTEGDLGEVLSAMLPQEKRQRIEALIREAFERHGQSLVAAVRPIVVRSLRESVPVMEASFRESLRNHREELEALGDRYRQEILEERLLPLVKEEVLPIVRKHGEPVAKDIGRELWDRASLWRFAWRGIYDKSPLPERDLLKREWERYLDEEAVPVVEQYTPELVAAQQRILVDVSKNERIRAELSQVVQQVAGDEEFRRLLMTVLRETVVDNRQLHEVWVRNWQSADAKRAVALAGAKMEPLVRQIGDELFGTRDGGIAPGFARVLRNQILGKDRRWLVAVPREPVGAGSVSGGGVIPQIGGDVRPVVRRGPSGMAFPPMFWAADSGTEGSAEQFGANEGS